MKQAAFWQTRIKELNNSIQTIVRTLNPDTASFQSTPLRSSGLKYEFMSVRWAILDHLHDSGPKTTAEIAEALKAAGIRSKATNFVNNVSSVLTTTMKMHDEVQQLPDSRWELTENGINAIEHIRNTPKFRRSCGSY